MELPQMFLFMSIIMMHNIYFICIAFFPCQLLGPHMTLYVLCLESWSREYVPFTVYVHAYYACCYTYGIYSRNGSNVPYIQYKMFTLINFQFKASNLLKGSLRQYSNCIQEKNSLKLSRAPVEGVRREATRVQFCSYLTD